MARIKQTGAVASDAAKPKRGRPPKAETPVGWQTGEKKPTSPRPSEKPLSGTESLPSEWQQFYLAVSREMRGE
ncbi:hypothetical protein ABE504_01450 [Paenibacillus oryzisoli]|uniref:hypothetical protein n=1 Tax=Paenibacillus oryzisoli TaxID=1850517 RepID=UPI003D2D7106